jgi:hypothetical protein
VFCQGKDYVKLAWTLASAANTCAISNVSGGQKKKALVGASCSALIWLLYHCLIPRLTAFQRIARSAA